MSESDTTLLTKLDALQRDVKEIRTWLVGNRLAGGPGGWVEVVVQHTDELYGDEKTKKVGLKEIVQTQAARIEKLEAAKNRVFWTALGVSMTASGGIGWLFKILGTGKFP